METDLRKLVGSRIREIRKDKGLTQEEVGEVCGFHYSYLGRLERGEKNISLDSLRKISDALQVDVKQLFGPPEYFELLTEKEAGMQEILLLLKKRSKKEIQMISVLLKNMFND
jgi:transcriptional regulator with XRE-family HTH domain